MAPRSAAARPRSAATTTAHRSRAGQARAGERGCRRRQEPAHDPFDGPVPVGNGMTSPGRGPAGRQGPTPPPPSLADRASRFGAPEDGPQRPSLPMPSGSPIPGLSDPITDREVKRDQSRRSGLIDPDEPAEGIRLL